MLSHVSSNSYPTLISAVCLTTARASLSFNGFFFFFLNRRTVEKSATSRSIANHNPFLKLQLSHSFTKLCISHKPTLEVLRALMTLIITVNILLSTLKQIEILAISRFKMIWRKRLRLCEARLGLIKGRAPF